MTFLTSPRFVLKSRLPVTSGAVFAALFVLLSIPVAGVG